MTTSPASFEIMDQDGRVVLSVAQSHELPPGATSQPEATDHGYGWQFVAAWFVIGLGVGALSTLAVDVLLF